MKKLASLLCVVLSTTISGFAGESGLEFAISFSKEQSTKALDGRMLLLLSTNDEREPRFQIVDGPETQIAFGIDIDGLEPEEKALFDAAVFGYPLRSLADLKPGEYWMQGLLHIYETFHRADGHTVKLPMDRGEGQHWNRAPGNLYSTPKKVRIEPGKNTLIRITLDQKIQPIAPPEDSKYIKHIKMKSEMLSNFWGRPMYLGAVVLLPEGFDAHNEASYPLVINHGHFPHTFGGFRTTPPDPDLKPDYSKRFNVHGYNRISQEHAYQFFKEWTGPDFPRMVIIKIQHANPHHKLPDACHWRYRGVPVYRSRLERNRVHSRFPLRRDWFWLTKFNLEFYFGHYAAFRAPRADWRSGDRCRYRRRCGGN